MRRTTWPTVSDSLLFFSADPMARVLPFSGWPPWAAISRGAQQMSVTGVIQPGDGWVGPESLTDMPLADGGSQKRGHYGTVGTDFARRPLERAFLCSKEAVARTARSCQGRAVVGRGEANP